MYTVYLSNCHLTEDRGTMYIPWVAVNDNKSLERSDGVSAPVIWCIRVLG